MGLYLGGLYLWAYIPGLIIGFLFPEDHILWLISRKLTIYPGSLPYIQEAYHISRKLTIYPGSLPYIRETFCNINFLDIIFKDSTCFTCADK